MIEPTKQRDGDQPLPVPGRECVQDALIAEIQHRKQLGIQRYGQPLMTHNGRDAIRDAREEAVDLAVYLMQVELETADLRAELAAAKQRGDDLANTLGDVLASFIHKVHPGYPGLQSRMESVATVEQWRAVLTGRAGAAR